jgi:hypothetical protein
MSLSDAEATALAEHLAALRRRLPAAANAARLAARRCSLGELKELVLELPTTKLQIDDHEIAITLHETKPANGYALLVDHAAYPDPFVLYSDDELAGVIAEAAGLDLSDLAQRRRAQRGAQLARRRLAASSPTAPARALAIPTTPRIAATRPRRRFPTIVGPIRAAI